MFDLNTNRLKSFKDIPSFVLQRSNRKTLSLVITPDAKLYVKAPHKISLTKIQEFIKAKQKWINKTLAKIEALNSKRDKLRRTNKIILFGREYDIKLDETVSTVSIVDNTCILPKNLTIKQSLINFYKQQLWEYLDQAVPKFSAKMNLSYNKLKITNAQKRFGSCNNRKTICFSWLNAILPTWVIDYIIVHELAHLKEMNHSRNFWNIVQTHYPNYKLAKQYIKQNQHQLNYF